MRSSALGGKLTVENSITQQNKKIKDIVILEYMKTNGHVDNNPVTISFREHVRLRHRMYLQPLPVPTQLNYGIHTLIKYAVDYSIEEFRNGLAGTWKSPLKIKRNNPF